MTEESDADEDTEISLRELLSRAVEDSVALRRRRVEKETERRKIVDTARVRRDAGRTIARSLKRWHTRRMRTDLRRAKCLPPMARASESKSGSRPSRAIDADVLDLALDARQSASASCVRANTVIVARVRDTSRAS